MRRIHPLDCVAKAVVVCEPLQAHDRTDAEHAFLPCSMEDRLGWLDPYRAEVLHPTKIVNAIHSTNSITTHGAHPIALPSVYERVPAGGRVGSHKAAPAGGSARVRLLCVARVWGRADHRRIRRTDPRCGSDLRRRRVRAVG